MYGNANTQVVQVCGQGYPAETALDPDNDRCHPCPYVEQATEEYKLTHPERSDNVHYIFVPCDGTVVTDEMLGCNGHK